MRGAQPTLLAAPSEFGVYPAALYYFEIVSILNISLPHHLVSCVSVICYLLILLTKGVASISNRPFCCQSLSESHTALHQH